MNDFFTSDFFLLLWLRFPLFLLISAVAAFAAGFVAGWLFTATRVPAQEEEREPGRVHTGTLEVIRMPGMYPVDRAGQASDVDESIQRLLARCESLDEPGKQAQAGKITDFLMAMKWLETHETLDGLDEAIRQQWRERS